MRASGPVCTQFRYIYSYSVFSFKTTGDYLVMQLVINVYTICNIVPSKCLKPALTENKYCLIYKK